MLNAFFFLHNVSIDKDVSLFPMFIEIDIFDSCSFFSSCRVCMTQQTSNATKNATILHRIAKQIQ